MSNEPLKMNITLDKTTSIVCEQCGNDSFQQVLFLRKASKFITGTPQDALMPIPTFACLSCNHINDEFKPSTTQEEV